MEIKKHPRVPMHPDLSAEWFKENGWEILHVDGLRFKLPKGFRGSIGDAFRALADYLDLPKEPVEQLPPNNPLQKEHWEAYLSVQWENFLEGLARGAMCSGVVGINAWNAEKQNYDILPLNTGSGLK